MNRDHCSFVRADRKTSAIIAAAIESDLSRFIPQNIYSLHQEGNFYEFINTLKEVTSDLLDQGMRRFLKPPAYITCEWALNIHGISLQAPVVCTVVTLSTSVGKKRNIQYQGITIEFSKISDRLFSGFIKHDNYYLATPEKAILDTLYYRRMIPAFDELDLDDVDYKTLVELAATFPSTVSRTVHKLMRAIGKS